MSEPQEEPLTPPSSQMACFKTMRVNLPMELS